MWMRRFLVACALLSPPSCGCAAAPVTDRDGPVFALAAVVLIAGAVFQVIWRRWSERRFLRGLFGGAR